MKGTVTLEKNFERIDVLDILKGIAVIMVVITHCAWTDQQRKQYVFPFWIDMAVPIFMVITGYLYSKSFYARKKIWDRQWMKKVCVKYTVPFFIIFVGECICYIFFKYIGISAAQSFSLKNALLTFIRYGGYGPGSYYYICLLQIIMFFPAIYWVINRMKLKGLILCFVVNFIYEILKTIIDMPKDLYRMVALRYVFALAAGTYIFFIYQKGKQLSLMFYMINAGIGFVFLLYANQYIGNWTPQILNQWTNTSQVASMTILPIVGGASRL